MSCDGNRTRYFRHVAANNPSIAQAFGGENQAVAALEQIFNTSRQTPATAAQGLAATRKTQELFTEMRLLNITPPTHSESGLPRRDAQMGYAVIYETIDAIRRNRPLPAVAVQVQRRHQESQNSNRFIVAPQNDHHGIFRCPNCGRFASRVRQHLCPQSANAVTMARFLTRRLNLPPTAYNIDQIQQLLDEHETLGFIRMTHPLSGEIIGTSLDGSLVALQHGYRPAAWNNVHLVTVGNNVIPVHNDEGLPRLTRSDVAYARVASFYGVNLQPHERILSPGAPASPEQGTSAREQQVIVTDSPFSPYMFLPPQPQDENITLTGGDEYSVGRFWGSEYRRRASQGTDVFGDGVQYSFGITFSGASYQNPYDIDSSNDTVQVGRTLLQAVTLLSQGHVHRNNESQQVELYTQDGSELLAIYDLNSRRVAGTHPPTDGSSMTPAQVAVILATLPGYETALTPAFPSLHNRSLHPLALVNTAHRLFDEQFRRERNRPRELGGGSYYFDAHLTAPRCPDCGRWMGSIHTCPASQDRYHVVQAPEQGYIGDQGSSTPFSNALQLLDEIEAGQHPNIRIDSPEGMGQRPVEIYREGIGLTAVYDPSISMSGLPYELQRDHDRPLYDEYLARAVAYRRSINLPSPSPNASESDLQDHEARIEAALHGYGVDRIDVNAGFFVRRCPTCGEFMGESEHICRFGQRSTYQQNIVSYINSAQSVEAIEQLPRMNRQMAEVIMAQRSQYRVGYPSINELIVVLETNRTNVPFRERNDLLILWTSTPDSDLTDIPDIDEVNARTAERQEAVSSQAEPTTESSNVPETIDLNTATLEELQQLPHIGPMLAQRIISVRDREPFQTIFGLYGVRGLGRQRIREIEQYTTFRDQVASAEAAMAARATQQVQEQIRTENESYRNQQRVHVPGAPYEMRTFQEQYDEAKQRRERGERPVPYMRENATGGLGAPGTGRGFGIEIEFVGGNIQAIGRALHQAGLTRTAAQQGYHSGQGQTTHWRFERDATVSGEIISPVLYDTPETWQQLEQVCAIVQEHGGRVNLQCGGHVHVGVGDYDHTPENHERLVRLYTRNQDVLYRLSQNPTAAHHRGVSWCRPIEEPSAPYTRHTDPRRLLNSHNVGLNFGGVTGSRGDHVEFRTFDGSLDPAVIQAQIKLSLAMTELAVQTPMQEVQAEPAQPLGYHRRQNSQRSQLTGEQWETQTTGFRSLIGRLFPRDEDREQLTSLFAVTKWQR